MCSLNFFSCLNPVRAFWKIVETFSISVEAKAAIRCTAACSHATLSPAVVLRTSLVTTTTMVTSSAQISAVKKHSSTMVLVFSATKCTAMKASVKPTRCAEMTNSAGTYVYRTDEAATNVTIFGAMSPTVSVFLTLDARASHRTSVQTCVLLKLVKPTPMPATH